VTPVESIFIVNSRIPGKRPLISGSNQEIQEAGQLSRQKEAASLHTNDPKAARSAKLPFGAARVKRIGVHDARRPEGPHARSRREARLHIIKQKKSRWWEVRDPGNELVCLTVYRKGAREVVRRLAA
jgi:hypothetical protein